jgi:hypothetical protein
MTGSHAIPRPLAALTALIGALAVLIVTGWARPAAQAQEGRPAEVPVQRIALAGPAADSHAELSGLAWYGDWLLLVDENPDIYRRDGYAGMFYALPKADLLAYLDAANPGAADPAPLEPVAVPVVSADFTRVIPGFDGFEAAAFDGDTIYMAIEVWKSATEMRGILVSGTIAPDLSAITLDLDRTVELLPQTDLTNISYETLVVAGDRLIALYEVNGAALNPTPFAYSVSLDFASVEQIPFPTIDYRITDATALGADGVFWGMNFFFTGDVNQYTDSDPIVATWGQGATHATFPQVERLVAFRYTPEGITLAGLPPIQFELAGLVSRNWEGLARLDARGFLVVTDMYPNTILGFVPAPISE